MIKIGILGDIGSGKSFISKQFRFPVFNADQEVSKIYKNNKGCFSKLSKQLPKYLKSFPVKKEELAKAIVEDTKNLKKIVKVVHPIIRKKMNKFLKINRNKNAVVLDVPLLIENKLNDKKMILIFIDAKKSEINKKLKKRPNYNKKLISNFRNIQKPLGDKKKISNYTIKNNFKLSSVRKNVNYIRNKILNERNSS
tara:strand:- start:399 stop:986 length:588 start_codon:yes stop_codon:yes gene_type:complete